MGVEVEMTVMGRVERSIEAAASLPEPNEDVGRHLAKVSVEDLRVLLALARDGVDFEL